MIKVEKVCFLPKSNLFILLLGRKTKHYKPSEKNPLHIASCQFMVFQEHPLELLISLYFFFLGCLFSSLLIPTHGLNTHVKSERFLQHLTFDELIFVIISHGHFASGGRTESFASWWLVNTAHWSMTPYASQIRTLGHVPGGPLGTHGGFGRAECFSVSLF